SDADYIAETYIQQGFPIVSKIVSNYSAITQQPIVDITNADYLKVDTASTLEIVSNSESEVGGGESERSAEQLKTAEPLAAQITKCQSWSAALELIDDASIATGKNRGTVLKKLIKCFNQHDRVRFLTLLNLHASNNPLDERASKALEIAQKYTSPEVSTLEEQT
ncbi:hypothetical protein, partial [Chlorogloea sp. CCALA 695]|uniref:hypothetical protein n=1 Tax=Chlorogloea sp. CCALA 695 TaxID=2107693 RepID=UPI000D3F9B8B